MIPDLLISIVCVLGLIIAFISLPISEYFYVQSEFPKAPVTSEEMYAVQDEVRKFFFIWWIVGVMSGLYIYPNEPFHQKISHLLQFLVIFLVIEWYFTTVKICLFKSLKEGDDGTNQGNDSTNPV